MTFFGGSRLKGMDKLKKVWFYFSVTGLVLVLIGTIFAKQLLTNLGIVISMLCLIYQNYRLIQLTKKHNFAERRKKHEN